MGGLGWALAGHVLLANVVGWPWVVPNLTLIGLVRAVARRPEQWALAGVLAGLVLMVWVPQAGAVALGGAMGLAGAVRLAGAQWDVIDERVEAALIVALAGAAAAGALWLEDAWSWPLAGWAVAQVAVTALAWWGVRWIGGRPRWATRRGGGRRR